MPAKLGELTALDMESGEAIMRNNDGALVRGHIDVRAGGMLVFWPGMGRWEPEPADSGNIAQERRNSPRARDAGRPPGTTKPAGENVNPADTRAADAERRRQERQEAADREQAERAARAAAAEQDRAAQEQASLDAIAAAAGETPAETPAGDGEGSGGDPGGASVPTQTETRKQRAERVRAERAAREGAPA